MALKTRKQIIHMLEEEFKKRLAIVDAPNWINDESGMWDLGYFWAIRNTLQAIDPDAEGLKNA